MRRPAHYRRQLSLQCEQPVHELELELMECRRLGLITTANSAEYHLCYTAAPEHPRVPNVADNYHREKAKEGRDAWNAFVNAQGSDFRANLRGAQLDGVKLARANLRGADLTGSGLRKADLNGARLSLANLEDADLSGANLRGAQLSGANLRSAEINRANLTRADLAGADLTRARCGTANFANADLTETLLARTDLRSIRNLQQARLKDARFDDKTRWPSSFDPLLAGAIDLSDKGDDRHDDGSVRLSTLGPEAQTQVRRALEPITGDLERLAFEDGSLSPEDEAYLRGQLGTLREQLRLEYDGDTRIIELAVANVTTRFAYRMELKSEARGILEELGTRPPELIDEIVARLNQELLQIGNLGAEDPRSDGTALANIGTSIDQIEDLVSELALRIEDQVTASGSKQRSMTRGFLGGLATSLAASGVEGTWQGAALRLLTAVRDLVHWLTTAG